MRINIKTYEQYVIDYLEGNLSEELRKEFDVFLLLNPEIKNELEDLQKVNLEPKTKAFDNSLLKKNLFTEENIEADFENLCIDYIENQFSDEEKLEFENYLKTNFVKQEQFELFKKTKLDKAYSQTNFNNEILHKKNILPEKEFDDELVIAYAENDLTKAENLYFEEKLNAIEKLQTSFKLTKKTVLKPKTAIVFSGKSGLKKKERKLVVLWSSVALAASVLLFGMLLLTFFAENTNDYISEENSNPIDSAENKKELLSPEGKKTFAYTEAENVNPEHKKKKTYEFESSKKLVTSNSVKEKIENKTNEKQNDENIEIIKREIKLPKFDVPVLAGNQKIKSITTKPTNIQLTLIDEISNNKIADKSLKENVKFWKVASVAVNVFSKATKAEVVLNSEYDENGNLLAVDFVSEKFNFTKEYRQ